MQTHTQTVFNFCFYFIVSIYYSICSLSLSEMLVHSHFPALEDFCLVVCHVCSKVVTPQGILTHYGKRRTQSFQRGDMQNLLIIIICFIKKHIHTCKDNWGCRCCSEGTHAPMCTQSQSDQYNYIYHCGDLKHNLSASYPLHKHHTFMPSNTQQANEG